RRNSRTGQVDLDTTKNIRWYSPLGPVVHGTPIVAEGRVLIGSNGSQSNRPQLQGDRGVLSCLDEKTGELLWELVVPKLFEIKYADWYNVGLSSVPTVEESKVYVVTNRGEILCLDINGMKNGNTGPFTDEATFFVDAGEEPLELSDKDADIIWCTDLVNEVGVMFHNAVNCSILIDGDFLYVTTGNGVDWTHRRVMNPTAPTLVVLDKKSGKIIARDNFNLGPNIVHGQWSSPSLGVVDGRKLVFIGTGNGYLFAVEALTEKTGKAALEKIVKAENDAKNNATSDTKQADSILENGALTRLNTVWQFNGHPLAQEQEVVPLEHFHDTRSYEVIGNPVFIKSQNADGTETHRIYVAFTQEMFHNIPNGWFLCLDASKTDDTTRSGGLVWAYPGISSTSSTSAIADGLVYISDGTGRLHCLDAETGEPYWVQSLGAQIWGSPLIADGKVYIGTAGRRFFILEHGKEAKIISQINMPDQVLSSATAANGTIFVPLFGGIYAVEEKQ
ncbi:MAG: PQQ-binding-like beta-propeller repeat protein, partial [Thermoguttaceae bacterium]